MGGMDDLYREQILEHHAGNIIELDLRELSIPAATKTVHQEGEAKIGKTRESAAR